MSSAFDKLIANTSWIKDLGEQEIHALIQVLHSYLKNADATTVIVGSDEKMFSSEEIKNFAHELHKNKIFFE